MIHAIEEGGLMGDLMLHLSNFTVSAILAIPNYQIYCGATYD